MQLSLLAQMLGVPQESLALKDEYERAEVAEVRNRDNIYRPFVLWETSTRRNSKQLRSY
jgi:hypothetical protein